MKRITVILLVLISFNSFSQTLNFVDLSGEKPRGTFQKYVSKDGETYTVGDTLILGVPSGVDGKFVYIVKLDMFGETSNVGPGATNSKAELKNIRVSGSKRSGFKANFQTKGSTAIDNYYFNIEDAIASGEVKSKGMTSDQAMIELKKAKDKLDLEIITQEEYDRIKSDLMRYIK